MDIATRLVRDLILLALSDKSLLIQDLRSRLAHEAQVSFCHDDLCQCSSNFQHQVDELLRDGSLVRLDSGLLKPMSRGNDRLGSMAWAGFVARMRSNEEIKRHG